MHCFIVVILEYNYSDGNINLVVLSNVPSKKLWWIVTNLRYTENCHLENYAHFRKIVPYLYPNPNPGKNLMVSIFRGQFHGRSHQFAKAFLEIQSCV